MAALPGEKTLAELSVEFGVHPRLDLLLPQPIRHRVLMPSISTW